MHKHLIETLEKRIDSFRYEHEHEKVADQIVVLEAKRALRVTQ